VKGVFARKQISLSESRGRIAEQRCAGPGIWQCEPRVRKSAIILVGPGGHPQSQPARQMRRHGRQRGVLHGVARSGQFRAQARGQADRRPRLLREQVHVKPRRPRRSRAWVAVADCPVLSCPSKTPV
jgi:hypothetical protein